MSPWLAALLLLLAALLGGFAPGAVGLGRTSQRAMELRVCNALSGGIFLGQGFMHLLPDAREAFEASGMDDFPYAGLATVLGFLFVVVAERFVVPPGAHRALHGHVPVPTEDWDGDGDVELAAGPVLAEEEGGQEEQEEGEEEEQEPGDGGEPRRKAAGVPPLLLFALSVHSFLAGAALGVQPPAASLVWALAAHKLLASLALGIAVLRGAPDKLSRVMGLFSLVTPAGVVAGVASRSLMEVPALEGWALGLGAGSFIYVAVVEVLQEELVGQGRPLAWRLAAYVVGAASMGLLAGMA